MVLFRHKVVDQNADIRLRTVEHQLFFSLHAERCIDARDQALRRSLLVSGTAVELAAGKQILDRLELEGRQKLSRVDAVILDCIRISHDPHMLQTRNSTVHGILHILRQGTGHAAQIHLVGVKPLRLNEYLVAGLIREFHYFIFNGRTVTRTGSLNRTGKQRRTIQIIADNLMRLLIRIGQPAGNLLLLYRFRIC